ncbi:MAG: hypothetical protein ACRC3Y_03135, partial [Romboutsia sp.]|uniref:hypothetical protein n=1 Tax=Romboutsia sp. TaxID=1965302 RepID=UPI003F40AB1D
MILKSLEDLENYKKSISIPKSLISLKDINEVQISGGESTNTCNNKLFYWNFEPYHIEEFVRLYEKVSVGDINNKKLYELELDLKFIAQEMEGDNTCPIEAILYSSKIINNLISSNNSLIETIGKVIADVYSKNVCQEYKETIKFILEEWSWDYQLMILINACGKIKDIDLLTVIYDRHTKGDTRLQALKAFMS